MRPRTEIWWIVFCIVLALVFYAVVRLGAPDDFIGDDGTLEFALHDSYFVVTFRQLLVWSLILTLLLNFALMGLKFLASLHPAFRVMGMVLAAVTGTALGIVVLMVGIEYFFYTDIEIPFMFTAILFLVAGMAFMAFKRTREIVDVNDNEV